MKGGCFFVCLFVFVLFLFSFVTFLMLFPAVSGNNRYTFFRPGFEVFCPVPSVLLPFSRGSVPTLFDSTIYFHFNIFKSPTKLQSSRFQRAPFPLGRAYKYAACIFCNTWFQIPCWQIVHVHIYHHGKIKLLFPAVQYQNTLLTSIYIYIFFHGHGSDRMFL